MKKSFFVVLTLISAQMACNLPRALPAQATPSLPTAMMTFTTIPSATAPASTDTPSPEATLTPALTPTKTPLPSPTQTETPIPSPTLTETLIPSPTLTGTATPGTLFSAVKLSSQVISLSCEPKTVRFEVTPGNQNIYSVVLFLRLQYKTIGERTGWNDGIAMRPSGDKFVYDLSVTSLKDFNQHKDPVAWVQFQLVATDLSAAVIGRSEVFMDKLTISAICP